MTTIVFVEPLFTRVSKTCPHVLLSMFHKSRNTLSQRKRRLRDKVKAQDRQRTAEKRKEPRYRAAEFAQQKARRIDKRTWPQMTIISIRNRAKMKGIEFDITADDIKVPERCPVLGIQLVCGHGGISCANNASVDRIDNSKGYIKGNVAVISMRANQLKKDASREEILALAKYVNGGVL